MFFKKQTSIDTIIVGLGNPGKKYEGTRHNAGFAALDHVAEKWGVRVTKAKFDALTGTGTAAGVKVLLMKPQTYMNNSGEAVRAAMDFYHLQPQDLLVIYDDMDLAVGRLRLRQKGSAGGHNGIKSIIAHIGTQTFDRIRVGIDKDPRIPTVNWVLGKIRKEDMDAYLESVNEAAKAAVFSVTHEFTETMNQFNKKQVKE